MFHWEREITKKLQKRTKTRTNEENIFPKLEKNKEFFCENFSWEEGQRDLGWAGGPMGTTWPHHAIICPLENVVQF
jgi:hypothetical protein